MWGATGAKKGAQWGADAHLPQLSAGPGPRKGSSVVLVTRSNSSRHTLLVWSGHATRGADADADGRVHALDVGTGAWSLLKGTSAFYGPPPPRWKSVTARAPSGDGLVVFGGDAEGGAAGAPDAYLNDLWAWRGAGWVNATGVGGPLPPARRAAAGALVGGDRLIVHGGRRPRKRDGLLDEVGEVELGEGGGAWRQLWPPREGAAAASFSPAPRKGHAAAALPDGSLFIYGGRNDSAGGCYFGDAASFAPAARAWTPLTARGPHPPPRDHAGAFYVPATDAVYVFGGRGGASYSTAAALGDLWSFSLTRRAWTRHPRPPHAPWPAPRFMFGLDAAPEEGGGGEGGGGHVVAAVFGGEGDGGARYGDAWAFSSRSGAWAPVTRGAVGAG